MVRQRQMEKDGDVVENTHLGCIWSIFRALNYSYWKNNVRKMLPYRKHHLPKYSKGTRSPRTKSIANGSESSTPVSSYTRKISLANKRSLRNRIKSLISKEQPKKVSYKRSVSDSPTQSRSQQTYLTRHLQSSDYIEVENLKNHQYYGKSNGSGSENVLEMYKVNKSLFSKILKNTDGGIEKSFCNLETHETRAKLTRSWSYPSPKSSQIFKFSQLDHKWNEICSHSKIDKVFANSRPQVVDGTKKYSRTLSLNELSFEKYVQLLPKSSTGEPKLSSSTSLRLTNECSFKRVRSISRIDFSGVFENEPSCDGYSVVLVAEADLDKNRNIENDSRLYKDVQRSDNKVDEFSNLVECINEYDTAKVPNVNEETKEQIIVLNDSKKDNEIDIIEIHEEKMAHSCSFLNQNNSDEHLVSLNGFLASKDFEWENSSFDNESRVDSQHECCSRSLTRSSTSSNKRFNDNGDDIELRVRNYNDFDYVSDILEKSGFMRNDLLAPWYSSDQPLNPSVFDEVEAYWPHENYCHKDEFCCHHQLLFDLINELLIQIYDTLFTYYPRALSSNCRVPLVPAKFNVLDEVWSKVSKIMNSKVESDPTVEAIVAKDIWNDDRWMNIQLESECVAIELEDMFFDELLEEIICSRESQ